MALSVMLWKPGRSGSYRLKTDAYTDCNHVAVLCRNPFELVMISSYIHIRIGEYDVGVETSAHREVDA